MIETTTLILFTKLALAAFLGVLIGAERTIAGKRAGMRTFALVAMGSALFVSISVVITTQYLEILNFDPMRISAAIISGIGFLGAGMILLRKDALHGLTTAAGLWVSAGVGMATGFGLYSIAIFTTLLTLFIFTTLWFIEEKIRLNFGKSEPVTIEDEVDTY